MCEIYRGPIHAFSMRPCSPAIAKTTLAAPEAGENMYLYRLAKVSPFPGTMKRLSYYLLCAILLYLNLEDLPTATQQNSLRGARTFATFTHGKQPWDPYGRSQRFRGFRPSGMIGIQNLETLDTISYEHLVWMEHHSDDTRAYIERLLFCGRLSAMEHRWRMAGKIFSIIYIKQASSSKQELKLLEK